MRCPNCQQAAMRHDPLPDGPVTRRCPVCGGRWLNSFQYWRWRERQPAAERAESDAELVTPAADSGPGKRCPECERFLTRRKVGRGVDFHLDRCGGCGGIWFDEREWDALVSAGLHRDLHFIFTSAWQRKVQEEELAQTFDQRVATIVGEADYAELQRLVAWLQSHPQRRTLLAYLAAQAEPTVTGMSA